ncbi:helix-turn-helix domain-containing protein [Muricauda sp. 334s03]|uniref:Helix-turn-helix domain-containing protein n=1 Tax=Flagellimonas yonaguniensis TaxID=3031325 RepID=A0ABT5Y3N9_9FLAO|nr:helix-turn-helix domain-containing protein [[Muricauda] yonaguniensis]MDF0717958.1 helix-turn-helix domain-containing protein [[Muricauda] yonaguniensis]
MDFIRNEVKEIKQLLQNQNLEQKEIFTVEDAAAYLQLSKSCLYKLTSKREIPFYNPGGKKIYFKKAELQEWIFSSRVESTASIDSQVETYLNRENKI